ncbi:hypothetical protein OCU04_005456 [Sclerotinia nivalis]|uniref:RING-type domain-containing protein n=1 Tax=Sclerotinia nivalis TaxID=352851 RepID=A0A9X0DMU3_9HELO|nr:hypothetical protein OCU04_005456 [Sclerotinia nivalis]
MPDYVPLLQDAVSPASQTRNGQSRLSIVLEAMKGWKTTYGDEKESCPVCFEDITATTTAKDNQVYKDIQPTSLESHWPEWPVITPCKHKFGSFCLGRWLLHSDSCPLCRTELVPHQRASTPIYDQPIQRAHSLGALDIFREPSYTQGTDMQDMTSIQTVSSRSTSSGSRRSMTTFEQQRWDTRMGGLGHSNPYFNDPRIVPEARSNQRTIPVRLPPTTTHGHPATPTSVEFTAGYVRRAYENANITSYDLSNQANSTTQLTHRSREAFNPRWRNWDFLSSNRRTVEPVTIGTRNTHSVADVVGLAMGVGTVVGMPRGERTIPAEGDSSVSTRRESNNDYSIANAMGQVLGVGTVVAIPRAEWRNSRTRVESLSESMSDVSIATQETQATRTTRATRLRESSSSDDDLSELPGLASSMWARTWG